MDWNGTELSRGQKKIPTKYFTVKLFAQVIQETFFYKTFKLNASIS